MLYFNAKNGDSSIQGVAQNAHGTSQNAYGTVQNAHGTSQNAHGTSQNAHGTAQNAHGTCPNEVYNWGITCRGNICHSKYLNMLYPLQLISWTIVELLYTPQCNVKTR